MTLTKPPTFNAANLFYQFVDKEVVCRTCDGGYRVQRKDEDTARFYLAHSSDGHFNAVLAWTCPNCRNDNYSQFPVHV